MRDRLIRVLRQAGRPLGILFTLLVMLYHAVATEQAMPMAERLDALFYDLRFRLTLDPPPPSQKIVIVDIDEQSLALEGQWPWSRARLGDMLQALYDAGAIIVAFDVAFAEPERNPVDAMLADPAIRARAGALLREGRERFDADNRFAEDIARGETVLGFFLHNDTGGAAGALPAPLLVLDAEDRKQLSVSTTTGYAGNLPVLQAAAAGAGSLTTVPDVDGVVRRSPLVYRVGDALYPSLSLEVARRFLLAENVRLETAWQHDRKVISAIILDANRVPTDASGRAVVPYRGGVGSYPYVPAADVLRGKFDPAVIEGAIVLVGTSALGLKDLRSTPLETSYPGVEVHANLLDAIIGSVAPETRFWVRPDYEAGATILLVLALGLLIVIVQPRLGAGGQLAVTLVSVAVVVGSNYTLWVWARLDFPLAPPLVTVVTLNAFFLVLGFLEESQRRAQIHGMFGQYVAPAHIDRLLEHPGQASFDGESKEMTVLFSDIRSFTTISEKLTAHELKQLLNRYFTPITQIIFDNQGTIDKYVGDMVMAFWGAPLDDPKHAEHAVDAALAMLRKIDELKEEFGAEGLPRIDVGVGINTGLMNVGDMGSSYRRAYTVLGDSVNLGSRLEGATKMYGIRLLVGENTAAKLSTHLLRHVDRLQVKGKNEPVSVYEPLCRNEQADAARRAEVEAWHRVLDHYFAQRWEEAAAELTVLAAAHPNDHLYQTFLERIARMREQPPGADWNGVYVAKEK